jgi:hypothetical protein
MHRVDWDRPHHLSLEVAVQAPSEASEVDPSPGPTHGSESDSDSRGVNDTNGPFTDTEAAPGRGGMMGPEQLGRLPVWSRRASTKRHSAPWPPPGPVQARRTERPV